MRARLLKAWPVLSKEFGLHPWNVGRLSYAEIGQYLDTIDQMAKEAEAARRQSRR